MGPSLVGWHGVLSAISVAGVAFALLGFEQADQLAGEIRNPQRNLPLSILGGFLIGTIIYVLLQIVFIAAPSAGWRSSCGLTRSSPRSAPA